MPDVHPNDQYLEYVLPATFTRIGEEWGICVDTDGVTRPEPGMLCRVKRKDGTICYFHVKEVIRRVSFGWKCTFTDPSKSPPLVANAMMHTAAAIQADGDDVLDWDSVDDDDYDDDVGCEIPF